MQYEFELDAEEQSRLFVALKTVRLGESIDAIKQRLGDPGNESLHKTKAGEFRSYGLSFYVKRVHLGTPNGFDQVVWLLFDKDRRLDRLAFSHLEPFVGEIIPEYTLPEESLFFTRPPAL